ncbi:MAG: PD40 domain-containing protein [Planctomycetes bacterium]|nr:PD40 domain-containing protein [Planctomycetota bacterium]
MRFVSTFVVLAIGVALPAQSGTKSNPASDPVRIAAFKDFIQHLSWSPDGKKFLFTRIHKSQMGLWTMNVDGSDAKPVIAKFTTPHFDGAWSPDSQRIVFVWDRLEGTDGKLQIDVVNADGTGQKNLLPHAAFDEAPRWSPDGKSIAFASTRGKNQDIWIMDAEGKNLKRLTSDPAPDNAPAWSPDGKQIAFTSGRSGNLDIWVMKADGSEVKRLTNHPMMDYWPTWSPDGKRIAFTSNRDGNYEIYVMNTDGTGQRNLTNHPATDNFATWSPDGNRLAFISNRGGQYGIYVIDVK